MKKLKYFLVLMLVGILSLTGCSVGKKLTVEERLEKALNNLVDADSITMKAKVDAKSYGDKMNLDVTLKGAKADKGLDLYLGADLSMSIDGDKEEYSLEGYLLSGKKKIELYFMVEDVIDDWSYIKLDLDELEDEGIKFDFDFDEIEDLKVDMDIFKRIKEVETEDGITKIKATIDADEIEELEDYDIEDVEVFFYIDKNNNLTKIELDLLDLINLDDFDKYKVTISFSGVNDTKVKVPSDVKDDAEEIDLEELLEELFSLESTIYGYDDDDDVDYDAEDIFYDIILSSKIETCSNGEFEVDFSNYKDELYLYDDEYDIKRIESGVIKFSPKGEECSFEITTPIVIDGKTCTRINEYENECK